METKADLYPKFANPDFNPNFHYENSKGPDPVQSEITLPVFPVHEPTAPALEPTLKISAKPALFKCSNPDCKATKYGNILLPSAITLLGIALIVIPILMFYLHRPKSIFERVLDEIE